MDFPEHLVDQEKAVIDLSRKIQSYRKSHWFKKRKIPSLEAELANEEEKQVDSVANFLEKQFPPFYELVETNYNLLKGSTVLFKLIHTDRSWFVQSENRSAGTLIKSIRGAMHQNGYLYGHIITTKTGCTGFQYPFRLRGKIDYLGKMQFINQNTKSGIMTRPRAFSGVVESRGITTMEINEREFFLHSEIYKHVVANSFVNEEKKRGQFVNNRDELYAIVADTRKKLRTTFNHV